MTKLENKAVENLTYREYLHAKQKEFNDLPVFFAFSNEQFKRHMEERGLTENDTDKIYRLGDCGGFYLKTDAPIIRDWLNRQDKLPELMGNPVFAEDAFYYEMCNHEYGINAQGAWDVCNCFGEAAYVDGKTGAAYLRDMGYSDAVIDAYNKARKRYFHDAMENEWF